MVHLKVTHISTTSVTHSGVEEILVFKMHKHSKEIIRNESYHYDNRVHIHKLDKYTHSMKWRWKYWLILSASPGITPTSMQNFTKKTHCIDKCCCDSICIDFVPD